MKETIEKIEAACAAGNYKLVIALSQKLALECQIKIQFPDDETNEQKSV